VQLLPDPPIFETTRRGAIAQLGERLLCKQEVIGSIPIGSTNFEPLTTCNPEFYGVFPAKRLLFNNPKVFLF
jgi:hypothetical protein